MIKSTFSFSVRGIHWTSKRMLCAAQNWKIWKLACNFILPYWMIFEADWPSANTLSRDPPVTGTNDLRKSVAACSLQVWLLKHPDGSQRLWQIWSNWTTPSRRNVEVRRSFLSLNTDWLKMAFQTESFRSFRETGPSWNQALWLAYFFFAFDNLVFTISNRSVEPSVSDHPKRQTWLVIYESLDHFRSKFCIW